MAGGIGRGYSVVRFRTASIMKEPSSSWRVTLTKGLTLADAAQLIQLEMCSELAYSRVLEDTTTTSN